MTKFQKNTLIIGVSFILIAIILGAFGAHGLEGKIPVEKIQSFETGVRYQMYHGFGFLFLAMMSPYFKFSMKWIVNLMLFGVIFFSFSIYFLAIQQLFGIQISKILGPITPIGGLLLILSWLILIIKISTQKLEI